MKKVIIFLLSATAAFLTSCHTKTAPDPNIHYVDVKCVILEKSVATIGGRYSHESKYFLLNMVRDTSLFTEWHGRSDYSVCDSVYYSRKIGDTVHFDYILKRRFWHKAK